MNETVIIHNTETNEIFETTEDLVPIEISEIEPLTMKDKLAALGINLEDLKQELNG